MKKEINIEKIVNEYEVEKGIHATDCGVHFKAGVEKTLELTKNRLFSAKEMTECFNSARETYRFKNGKFLDKHHSAESYLKEVLKKK
jgi:hypothetical protein